MLVIVLGPTGIGKTALTIEIAKQLGTEIISCDSRQVYKGLSVGTAAPTAEEQSQVKHHLVQFKNVDDYYNAYLFEQDALKKYDELSNQFGAVLMTGGSGMYIDVVCNGIDDIPDIDEKIRSEVWERFEKDGLDSLRIELQKIDPLFYSQTDLKNHKRIIRGIEVYLQTGKPYSSFRTNSRKTRNFPIVKIGLKREREELYERINLRVDQMFEQGLVEEARRFYGKRHLNSLNTVGYKEIFASFDGEYSLERAKELIQRNSRRYAKKQISWFYRDKQIEWFDAKDVDKVLAFTKSLCAK